MKKQVSKEITRLLPLILAVIGSMASMVMLLFQSRYVPFDWILGLLGASAGAILVYFTARVLKAFNAPRVFISYSHKDSEMVTKICKELENYTVEVLLDKNELNVGDNINQKLTEMVDSSDYFIYVNSKNSIGSSWGKSELEKAIEQRKKILPIRLDETKMPEEIFGLFFANFTGSFDEGIEQLGAALKQRKKVKIISRG